MKVKFLSFIAIAAMLMVACEKNNGREEKVDPLTQAEQKEELQEIGLELVDYAGVSNWSDAFTSVVKFVNLMDDKDNDMSAFEHLEGSGLFGTKQSSTDYEWVNYGWVCSYQEPYVHDNSYETEVQLSKIDGKHVLDASKKAWVYTPASEFSIEATVDGQPMSVTAKVEDGSNKLMASYYRDEEVHAWQAYKTGPAMYGQMVHNNQYDYDEFVYETRDNGGNTEYHIYNPVNKQDLGWIAYNDLFTEATQTMIDVPAGEQKTIRGNTTYINMPSSIKASFTDGTSKVADIDFALKYTGAAAGVLDLSADKLEVSGTFEASGYTLKSEHLDFLKDNAVVNYTFSRGKDDIITMEVKESGMSVKRDEYKNERVNGQGEGSSDTWTYTNSGVGYDISTMPQTVEVSIDILGKLQVKGNCDFATLAEISDKITESRSDEATFKSWVGQAEQHFKLDVFYNGGEERSAYIGLEPVQEQGGDGKITWEVVPVIRFTDGSAYAMFEVFFNETDFADLITAISNWEKEAEEFINKALGKGEEIK